MKHTHTLLTAFICMLFIQVSDAQCCSRKGRPKKTDFWGIQTGTGLFPTFLKDRTQILVPPLLIGVDYRLKSNFSLGLQAGFSVSEAPRKVQGNPEPFMHRNHYTTIALRASAHTTTLDRWEVFGGMMAGYGASFVEVRSYSKRRSPEYLEEYSKEKIYLSAFIGGRYAVTRNIGVFTELGFGISVLSLGMSWRIL